MKKRTILTLIGVFAIIFGFCFYFTPHWVISNMKKAADNKDADTLSEYVDYPSFKESLKANLNTIMVSEASKMSDNPFAAFGAALATIIINPMIDNFVTPESLAMLMKGEQPSFKKNQDNGETQPTSDEGEKETSIKYKGFNRFIFEVGDKNTQKEPIQLIFRRHGIISWKLSAIRLPIRDEKKTYDSVSGTVKIDTKSNNAKIDDNKPKESEKSLLIPFLTNKRFRESNYRAGVYRDSIVFDITWITSGLEKPTRAVKGILIVGDIFCETKFRIRHTINDPLNPGESHGEFGLGLDYNPFTESHEWFKNTELKDMTFSFEVEDIIYQDGTKMVKKQLPS